MFKPDFFVTEFDEEHRILHLSYCRRVHPSSEEHLNIIFSAFCKLVEGYTKSGRIYLIVDMTNLIIEPELKAAYASCAREIIDKYLMPDGVARYGFQITRITVRASYDQYLNDNPNIFNSREEAFEYIYSLIEKNIEVPQP